MAGDPYWNYKVLGLHCDGANGSTTFTDVTGKTVTANGNAQISTAQYPALIGKTSSALLDGAGDYISIPDSSDFAFGSGDFTIRLRFYFSSVPGDGQYATFYSHRYYYNSDCSIIVYYGGTEKFVVDYSSDGTTLAGGTLNSATPSANTWHDLEITRNGANLDIYFDGIKGTTHNIGAASLYNSSQPVVFFAANNSGTYGSFFNGYASEIEIYKGVALHTANFTPSSAPFKDEYVAVSGTTKDSSNAFASRLVRVYRRDTGALVGSVISNATTGVYKVIAQNSGTTTPLKHFVLCFDATADPPGSPTENALIYDNITPA